MYLISQSSPVQTYLTRKIASVFSEQLQTNIQVEKVKITFFKGVVLEDILIEDQSSDTLAFIQKFSARIDSFNYKNRHLSIKNIEVDDPNIFIKNDTSGYKNYQFLIDYIINKEQKGKNQWNVDLKSVGLKNAETFYYFNPLENRDNIQLKNLNFDITGITFSPDSVAFSLNNLSLTNNNNLNIKKIDTEVKIFGNRILTNNLLLQSQNSAISADILELKWDTLQTNENFNYDINLLLNNSILDFSELSAIIPSILGMDQQITLSGEFYGNLYDLNGRDVKIETGDSTNIELNFYANSIFDLQNLFLLLDIKNLETDFNDISNFNLPETILSENILFPDYFYENGKIRYQGNFTGFLSDFVAYGTLNSDLGTISTDLSIKPSETGEIEFQGKLGTSNFSLGNFLNTESIDEITFNGQVSGTYHQQQNHLDGKFDGIINSIYVNNYNYKNILLDGFFTEKEFDGEISIDDPNLRLDFSGRLFIMPEIPEFDYELFLYKADLIALNIDTKNQISDLSCNMNANFKGNNIDNLEGYILLENGNYRNENGEIPLNGIKLNTSFSEGMDSLTFNSEYIGATISGNYKLRNIKDAFIDIINKYIPAIEKNDIQNENTNRFTYDIQVKDLNSITKLIEPEFEIISPFEIKGNIDSEKGILNLNCEISGVTYKNIALRNISFYTNSGNIYESRIKCEELKTRDGYNLYNIAFNSDISDNLMESRLTWNNFHELTYSGEISTSTIFSNNNNKFPHIEIDINPSQIFIADTSWQIDPSHIFIDSTSVEIKNLKFYNNQQSFVANGKLSEDNKNKLDLFFENIRLNQLDQYLQKQTSLNGILNGSLSISDIYNNAYLVSDIIIKDLFFREQKMGDFSILNTWDNQKMVVETEIKVLDETQQKMLATGIYDPQNNYLDFNAEFDQFSLVFLEKIIRNNLSEFHGEGSGEVKIYGNPNSIKIDGSLYGENAGLTVDFTQVGYSFNDSVHFSGDSIIFDHITVQDEYQNTGIFDGSITHANFKNMEFDLSINSPGIHVLNTTPNDNKIFYGQAYAQGEFFIKGQSKNVNMSGNTTSLSGTNVNISLDYEQDVETYDFVRFISNETSENDEIVFSEIPKSSTTLDLIIQATTDAKIQIIYDSQDGDMINATGEGVLRLGIDSDDGITLFGDYIIDQGDYLFTLQNVINKKFTIESGSSINWSGDPYNAILNVSAIYRLNASLYELFVNTVEDINYNQRIPVECNILISENLNNPEIEFQINFPISDERVKDELQQLINTDEEMNRQILSLLVLGSFYTPEYMRGTYEANTSNMIGNTASELFSNQLSNWLSQISNDVDIGLNYRPGNQLTDDEIEFALSTQMFNDRVSINGNISNNTRQTDLNNSTLVGDFNINVKLSKNGKLQLKAYNQSNNNLIYETAPYTQGIGLTYKEEFNTIPELIDKIYSLFVKEKTSQPAVLP